jgi:hypothetical protein
MQDKELITEEEWYKRCVEEKTYIVIEIRWSDGFTRVQDVFTGELFDVRAKKVGKVLMLEVKKVNFEEGKY